MNRFRALLGGFCLVACIPFLVYSCTAKVDSISNGYNTPLTWVPFVICLFLLMAIGCLYDPSKR